MREQLQSVLVDRHTSASGHADSLAWRWISLLTARLTSSRCVELTTPIFAPNFEDAVTPALADPHGSRTAYVVESSLFNSVLELSVSAELNASDHSLFAGSATRQLSSGAASGMILCRRTRLWSRHRGAEGTWLSLPLPLARGLERGLLRFISSGDLCYYSEDGSTPWRDRNCASDTTETSHNFSSRNRPAQDVNMASASLVESAFGETDFYKVLGLDKSAKPSAIKKVGEDPVSRVPVSRLPAYDPLDGH